MSTGSPCTLISDLFTGQPEDALHTGDTQSSLNVVGHPEWDFLWHS